MDSSFSVTGGARIGWWNVTIPFARLSADRDVLRLHCFIYGRDHVFYRSSIKRLSRHSVMFSIGLRIEHTVPEYPKFVVFWVSIRSRPFLVLKEKLEHLGYVVEAED